MQTQITVSTKKGHSQVTTWKIVQERPYPDVGDYRMAWRNGGQLFPAYSNSDKTVGIGKRYRCELDRNTAGTDKPPSTLIFRGEDLGQISITPSDATVTHYTEIRIRGHERPTTSVSDWITAQVLPSLLETIAAYRAELYAEAVTSLRGHFALKVSELRADVDRLEREAADVMTKL